MKAIRYLKYGDVDVLEYDKVPDPTPAAKEILVKLYYASVNPVDWKIRAGLLQQYFNLKFPIIPGRDGSGVVVAIGSDVRKFSVGDSVCLISNRPEEGTYAELIACDEEKAILKPPNIDYQEAAAYPSVCVPAWTALMNSGSRIERGMKVLIHGAAGGVGGITVQLAKHLGAEVAGTCHSKDVDYLEDLGVNPVISYDKEDFSKRLNDYDFVFDTVGGDVHRRSYNVLKKGGNLVYLIAEPVENLLKKFDIQTRLVEEKAHGEVLRQVSALVSKGIIKPQACHTFALFEARDAHRLSERGHVRGKIMLQIR